MAPPAIQCHRVPFGTMTISGWDMAAPPTNQRRHRVRVPRSDATTSPSTRLPPTNGTRRWPIRDSVPPRPPRHSDHPRTGHHSGLTRDSASPCPARHDDHLRTGHDDGAAHDSAPCPLRRGDHLWTGHHGGLSRESPPPGPDRHHGHLRTGHYGGITCESAPPCRPRHNGHPERDTAAGSLADLCGCQVPAGTADSTQPRPGARLIG